MLIPKVVSQITFFKIHGTLQKLGQEYSNYSKMENIDGEDCYEILFPRYGMTNNNHEHSAGVAIYIRPIHNTHTFTSHRCSRGTSWEDENHQEWNKDKRV